MNRFMLKEGKHTQGGQCFAVGEVVESPLDLDTIFVGKFERLNTAATGAAGAEQWVPYECPPAAAVGLVVLTCPQGRKAALFNVFDEGEPAPMNTEPLVGKTALDAFLKSKVTL